jgi:hypothetical protein
LPFDALGGRRERGEFLTEPPREPAQSRGTSRPDSPKGLDGSGYREQTPTVDVRRSSDGWLALCDCELTQEVPSESDAWLWLATHECAIWRYVPEQRAADAGEPSSVDPSSTG